MKKANRITSFLFVGLLTVGTVVMLSSYKGSSIESSLYTYSASTTPTSTTTGTGHWSKVQWLKYATTMSVSTDQNGNVSTTYSSTPTSTGTCCGTGTLATCVPVNCP